MEQNNTKNPPTLDDTISQSEAAKILGLSGFRAVAKLIKDGHLKAYRKKWSNYRVVLREDVEALKVVEEA
tara:strand:+ start:154 stop:363 length:210 start_codon:yes stop_codon:yes gene_type:complete